MSEPEFLATTSPRYVLYDFDTGRLATTAVFQTHSQAADAADRLQNVLIVSILIPIADTDESGADEATDQACDCEQPGFFRSGIPGILAHLIVPESQDQ